MSFLSELKRRNVVRVALAYLAASWFLIQVVETVFPIFGLPNELVRMFVIVLAIGFVPALIVSWLYELTPGGLKLEKDVDPPDSVTHRTGKRLDRAIIVMLLLAVGYFALDKFVLSENRTSVTAEAVREGARSEAAITRYGKVSIAVLPFDDYSPAGNLEYLSDGLAEELLNLLAQIRELRVISRTSAFSYKNRTVKATDVAEELKVGHVIEGSVRSSGNRLRITVQLIDAQTDSHVWSQTYDKVLDDVFAVQDDIAMNVVEKLKLTLFGPAPETRHVNVEAYKLFLQANQLRRQSTAESFAGAVELYQRALEIEPDYVEAWDRLGLLYCMQANFGLVLAKEGFELCRQATEKALALDPDYAPAISGLGWIAMQRDGDLATAARYYERALALAPTNVAIIGDAATLLQLAGRLEEAIALVEFALARDPVNPIGYANLGTLYRYAGILDKATDAYRTSLSLSPDRIGGHYQMGIVLLRKGEAEAALASFLREASEDWKVMGVALASHALGRSADSAAALEELKAGWGDRWPTEVAQVYAWIGDNDAAFSWLQKSLAANGDGSWPDIRVDDLLAPLHADPRWPGIANKLGVPAAKLSALEFSVTLPAD